MLLGIYKYGSGQRYQVRLGKPKFDLAAMTNSLGSQGQFTVCASGILETFSTDFEPYPNWQIESINLGHFSFFSEVP